ncbi:MAG: hypothetical protein ACR2QF_14975, partial [Geminicoccaceae bacterium]
DGHDDDRHIDPDMTTDEELKAKASELDGKLADLETLLSGGTADAAEKAMVELTKLRGELDEFKEEGLACKAREILATEVPVGLADTLAELHAQIEERCVPEKSSKIDDLDEMAHGNAAMIDKHTSSLALLNQKLTSGGGQGGPFAHGAAGVRDADIWLLMLASVVAFGLGVWWKGGWPLLS